MDKKVYPNLHNIAKTSSEHHLMTIDSASQCRSNYQSPSMPIPAVSKSTVEERSLGPRNSTGSRSVILPNGDSASNQSKENSSTGPSGQKRKELPVNNTVSKPVDI